MIVAERVTRAHRREESLLRTTRRFAAEADPAHLVDETVQAGIDLVGGSAGVVARWDEERQLPQLVAATGVLRARRPFHLGEAGSGRAASSRLPVSADQSSSA